MRKIDKKKLTLDRPVTYQITVPGAFDKKWLDWNGGTTVTSKSDENGNLITVLTLTVDQAALQGLLRHLYSLGLPLISVIWVDFN
jgi:hypothetical protein